MNGLKQLALKDAENVCSKVNFSELKGKRVLVTGASGLVGVCFLACLNLLAQRFSNDLHVFAVTKSPDNDFTRSLLDYKGASVLSGDLTDRIFLDSLPEVDYVIHAAGYGQPGLFMENPLATIKLNTLVTCCLIEKLSKSGKFLFVSSSEVYSGLSTPPFSELDIGTTNTTHPRSCYIESKRCGEAICNASRTKGIQAKSARLGHTYGLGTKLNDRRVINSFIQQAIQKQRIDLLDKGLAIRNYCYVSDAVEIMWDVLLRGKEPIYNVGGPFQISIAGLANLIGNYVEVPVNFPEKSEPLSGAPDNVFLSMKLVESEFGKVDYVSFEEGIKRTIDWQKLLYL